MNKKGFTLIELLVVIAIIGILSSIAIVYLSDARQKANDSKVQSNLTTAATQLELDRANNLNMNGDPFLQADDIDLIEAKIGAFPCGNAAATVESDGSGASWSHALCSDTTIFCADSQGYRGIVSSTPGTGDATCN